MVQVLEDVVKTTNVSNSKIPISDVKELFCQIESTLETRARQKFSTTKQLYECMAHYTGMSVANISSLAYSQVRNVRIATIQPLLDFHDRLTKQQVSPSDLRKFMERKPRRPYTPRNSSSLEDYASTTPIVHKMRGLLHRMQIPPNDKRFYKLLQQDVKEEGVSMMPSELRPGYLEKLNLIELSSYNVITNVLNNLSAQIRENQLDPRYKALISANNTSKKQ